MSAWIALNPNKMGAWGTAIFSDDSAVDVRNGFRALVGNGADIEQATDRVIAWFQLKPPGDPYEGAGWLGLAVTQWNLGRLVDRVRDAALAAIEIELASPVFEGKDLAKRAMVLTKTHDQLISAQPPEKKVPRSRMAQTPFRQGDMVSFTTHTGRKVAIWILENRVRKDIAGTSANSFLRVWAVGDPEIPPFEELISSGPLVKTKVKPGETNGYRTWIQGSFTYPQDAVGSQWTILGNAPYVPPFGGDDDVGTSFNFIRSARASKSDGTLDDFFERLHVAQLAVDPLVAPVQRLCDVVPGLLGFRRGWQERALDQAALVVIACAQTLERNERAALGSTVAVLDKLLAGDRYDRQIGLEVVRGLANLATHPTVHFDRSELESGLPTNARVELRALDAAWVGAKPVANVDARSCSKVDHRLKPSDRDRFWWISRARTRATADGRWLRLC
jgi:hypothetical protein